MIDETTPVSLTKVEVTGADSIDDELMAKLLTPLLSSSDKCVGTLLSDATLVQRNLKYIDLFDSINVKFDKDDSGILRKDILGEFVVNVDSKIDLKCAKLSTVRFENMLNSYGNVLGLTYQNKNAFGNAEYVSAKAFLNRIEDFKTSSIGVDFKTPMLDPSLRFVIKALYREQALKLFDSKQISNGFDFGLEKKMSCSYRGANSTLYAGLSYQKRSINEIPDSASDEVKTYAGDVLKQSLFLNFKSCNMKYISKSNGNLPLNGTSFEFKNELAGLLDEDQDKFYKVAFSLKKAKSTCCNWVTLTTGLDFGKIFHLDDGNTVHFQDKFYPNIPGQILPVQPSTSIGANAFTGYSIGLLTKCFLKSTADPIRLYSNLSGVWVGAEGFDGIKSCKNWNNGVDMGLIYRNDVADAKVYVKQKIGNSTPQFGFEVKLCGDW
ncbi:hypothetical protein DAMA08_032780 [Martiniozyma asiatica (nom. inval.)]|nr:hypothetical protein DAMA08_032780 [Martiniozyma asiatica]